MAKDAGPRRDPSNGTWWFVVDSVPAPDGRRRQDVKIVSERLGHTSPLVTWQTYQHVIKGMQTDAAEKVAALIFGPTTA